ncbi:hypothetical protein HYALB_00003585 [Hymenoscyphus albidus]|uniref:Uncharacterized protein n=1 Tax=Hymenoscyphus albidus TaxID=595503 RepID=A0A9N9M2H6_9HELO|nr:hypothetical protein HYALB_00003585 [Hymenoscyphus albidus]
MELQFATNHLGPFLFTNLLIPYLMPSGTSGYQSRIINTCSEAHRLSPIRFSDLNQEPETVIPEEEEPRKGLPVGILRRDGRYEPMIAYGMSKCANLLMVVGLREKLDGRGFEVWTVNPGNIMTDLPRGIDKQAKANLKNIKDWKTHDQGVATLLFAALCPFLKHDMGIYLDDCTIKNPSRWAVDKGAAEKLWKLSEEVVGLEKVGSRL